ncbi:MAG TPA: pitrilysin family protein [Vicinamibacterales bacterium]|nr:pitrilysin family protein [Vicinamibacterales bacterium]
MTDIARPSTGAERPFDTLRASPSNSRGELVEPRGVDRSRLPEPGPARTFVFPAIRKSTLDNGLGVWTVYHPQVPVVSLMLLVRRGSAADPNGKEGLAAITADMLDEGSGDRSAIEIHEALAQLGAQFDTDIGSDAIVVSTTALSRFTDRVLALMADVVVRPALRDADFARVRQLRLHRLTQLRDIPSAVADRAFLKLLYGTHPYGHAPIGTETALRELTADDVRAFHAGAIRPSASTLVAVGDCAHDEIVRFAASAFGDWAADRHADGIESLDERLAFEPGESLAAALPSRLAIVDRPGAPQSELRIGHVGVPRSTPDYHALLVANAILGGQFVSRINLNLREDKGFTYGARTAFEFRRMAGPFVLQVGVQTAATAAAIRESLQELSDIRGERPASAEELALGIAALTRGYARNFETADQIARGVMQLALYDLADDYFATFVPAVEAVTCDDVSRVMRHHLDPNRLITLIVGDAGAIGDVGSLPLGAPVTLPPDSF